VSLLSYRGEQISAADLLAINLKNAVVGASCASKELWNSEKPADRQFTPARGSHQQQHHNRPAAAPHSPRSSVG